MKPYWLRVLVAFDQQIGAFVPNWLLPGADEDQTISSRLGKCWRGDYGAIWHERVAPLRNAVNAFFGLFGQKDHCSESIEEDEGVSR